MCSKRRERDKRHGGCVVVIIVIQRNTDGLMGIVRARPMLTRLGAIFVVAMTGIAAGWGAGFALHRLVNHRSAPAPPVSAPAPTPAPVEGQTDDSGLPDSDKPDVIIAIP